MTSGSLIESADLASKRFEPIYFRSGSRTLFGWLQYPIPASKHSIGLVICNPFGYEAICCHRSIREFAHAVAATGIPSLRFDYAGTGDSADLDDASDQVEIWTQDTLAAVAELRSRAGVRSVYLLGFRLGGLIATLASRECPGDVAGLILVSPVISGRRYLRELRTTRLASALGPPGGHANISNDTSSVLPPGSIEAGGFFLSGAAVESLSPVDLNKTSIPPETNLLVIDGESLTVSRSWADAMTASGARVTYKTLPGLVEMLMTPPQFAQVPLKMLSATCEWLRSAAVSDRMVPMVSVTNPSILASPSLVADSHSNERLLLDRIGVSERAVFFGTEEILFGVVTEPRSDERRRRAVILMNSGADYHIGASGMYVALARRWAGRGYVVLRMDLSGLGDSGTRKDRPPDDVFPSSSIEDIAAAIEFVQGKYNPIDVTLAGLCSGAYHALRAAIAGLPAVRILLINPQNYFWTEGMTVNDIQVAELVRNPELYRSRAFSWQSWRRLLAGDVDLKYVSKILGSRVLLTLGSKLRDFARRIHIQLPHDLGSELERVAARGVQIVFIFARGEPGISLLKIQAGSSITKIGDRCRVRIINNGDHVFSTKASRVALEKVLDEELFKHNVLMQKDAVGALEQT